MNLKRKYSPNKIYFPPKSIVMCFLKIPILIARELNKNKFLKPH
jgi:hypothetical protein